MQKITSCLICILALLAFLMPAVAEDHQNAALNTTLNTTQNAAQITKVLRIGFEKTKAIIVLREN